VNSPLPCAITGLTKLNEDIVVPRGRLEDLFTFTARLQKHATRLPHRLLSATPVTATSTSTSCSTRHNPAPSARSRVALDELFRQVLAWDGVITGEHGIGLAKMPWWPLAASPAVRALHHEIKHALDPRGILNPGKFVNKKPPSLRTVVCCIENASTLTGDRDNRHRRHHHRRAGLRRPPPRPPP